MLQNGARRVDARQGPWLGLLVCLVLAVVCAIAALSWSPVRPLESLQPDLTAPHAPAPAAPSAMR
jgi:hypothetical protein